MNSSKENNNFYCNLSNEESYKQSIAFDNSPDNPFKKNQKVTKEIEILKKSLLDLQSEKEDLNILLLDKLKELKRSQKNLNREIHKELSKIMSILSHKVRLPLTNILGLANLLTNVANSDNENLEYIELIKISANDLDIITKEFGYYIYDLNYKKKAPTNNH
ncbi:MAG: sensor histidine kinase [Flavobacterium sp.]|nr:MAG: sensor histidine kinase [Flavobacterium sp.]